MVSTPKIPLVGETDPESKVTLLVPATGEKRAIQADREGKFCFEAVSLFPGNNLLKLRSQDEIGNTAEQKLLVNFARKTIRRSIISLDLKGADLPSVIRGISQQGGLNVVIGPEIQGEVTISLHNVTPRQALTSILKIHGYDLLGEDGVLRVIKPEKVEFGSRLFCFKYIELDGLGEGEEQLLKQMSSFLCFEFLIYYGDNKALHFLKFFLSYKGSTKGTDDLRLLWQEHLHSKKRLKVALCQPLLLKQY